MRVAYMAILCIIHCFNTNETQKQTKKRAGHVCFIYGHLCIIHSFNTNQTQKQTNEKITRDSDYFKNILDTFVQKSVYNHQYLQSGQ